MTVATWQPGTLYNPGALVIPQTAPPVLTSELENGSFEDGDTGWDKSTYTTTAWVIQSGTGYDGTMVGRYPAPGTGFGYIINDTVADVTPGQQITLKGAVYADGDSSLSDLGVNLRIRWYDAADVFISESFNDYVGGNSTWYYVSVTGTAPAGAAKARGAAFAYRNSGPHNIYVDALSWDYVAANAPEGLIFRAVQADAGFSGNLEPTWPTVLGSTVVDNQVTWEAVLTTRVTWEASPILVSGSYEPIFPTTIGGSVADNTINWQAVSRRIEDTKCPNTPATAIAASKIFAGDDDIVAFSATINPLDWSTRDDAGYLPFGLQTYGSQPVTALGLYRGNLVAFNSTGFQMWQVDQDPANMAILDSVPVSCTFPRTVQGISNDLVFLNAKGVRNISIAGGSTNLQASDVGGPIDPLVVAKIRADVYEPIGLYWPAQNQYWLIFGDEAFVMTVNGANKRSWGRYTFPAAITDWTLDGDDLVLRAGALVWRMDDTATADDMRNLSMYEAGTGFNYVGFEAAHSIGSVLSTDLTEHTIIQAAYNTSSGKFEIIVSDIFADPDAFTGVKVYDSSDVTAMQLIGDFDVADAEISYPGNISIGPTLYQGCAVYAWDSADIIDYMETFTVEIIGMDDDGLAETFEGIIHFPHLDLGTLGREKQLVGFDLVSDAPEGVTVSVGYDQRDLAARTAPYEINADTLPGQLIPIPVSGPSFDFKLVYAPRQQWEWQAANLYVQDRRLTS